MNAERIATLARTGAVELTRAEWARIHQDFKSDPGEETSAFAGALDVPGCTRLVRVVIVSRRA